MTNTENKKKAILQSATRLFSQMGFSQATLSQVAKGAGITTSGIYNYFKSKEEILFAIIENFMSQSLKGLQEHLEGIHGAENKLRKAIWFHCRTYSQGKKEIQIILESRSYPDFYESQAYIALRDYSRVITQVISEGMEQGVFHDLSRAGLLRDMILGAVDHLALDWTINNAPSPLEFADRLFDIIMASVTPQDSDPEEDDKKERKKKLIIDSASRLFAANGYSGTNMLAVAKEAGVAEGTIYEYYQNKENLLISIPRAKLEELLAQMDYDAPERNLRESILSLFRFYYQDRDYSTILILMLRPNRSFYNSESNQSLDRIFSLMERAIVQGQEKGLFSQNVDVSLWRNLLFGAIDHILIPWIIFNREYDLMQIGREVSRLVINALQTHGSQTSAGG
ncbi:TetR/AcrR family transcriptional regulator [Desulfatibacillum aliphaticivorans]|uniref:TetR/AcrR family transcriptional regulator n=1 Tax=Desulfatibacillum aliphaticivorans TaxID=218208 RepID=UPI0004276CF1|nr:TetR/AcrR family transcriptional regulator [Desulfatibacillum aliphaticivorans]